MITCLEGPSAVGKTTICRLVEERGLGHTIPEVNALFLRPQHEQPNWYLECQQRRWEMAQDYIKSHTLVLLDGDPFQPLWYNWTYNYRDMESLDSLRTFYRPRIESGRIGFPNRYVLLSTDERELRRRKDADPTRSRRNFEAHLQLMQTQRRYFDALSDLAPGMVEITRSEDVEDCARSVVECASSPSPCKIDSLPLFDGLVEWLQTN